MGALSQLAIGCGLFILIPSCTFGIGLWSIYHYIGMKRKLSGMLFALLIGLIAFEASFIGIAIDPRWNNDWKSLLTTSGLIAIAATFFVLIFTPLFVRLIKVLSR